MAIPLWTDSGQYQRGTLKIITQRMRCQGRGWDQESAGGSLRALVQNGALLPSPETWEKFPCQATVVSLPPNKWQMPQESSFCKQYLLLGINTSFQSLKFISTRMMFMTLWLVILSWILSTRETGLAHGPRHLWLWIEPLFKERWGQMELIYRQVDECGWSGKGPVLAERRPRTKDRTQNNRTEIPTTASHQPEARTMRSELPGQEKQPNVKAISQPSRKKQQALCIEIKCKDE